MLSLINVSENVSYKSVDKKWNFPLRLSSVNVTKSGCDLGYKCRYGHIYWKST